MMEIRLQRLDDAFHFRAVNPNGRTAETDASPALGGHNQGLRPMEMLLTALGSCSAIDVVLILKKQRQALEDLEVAVRGERDEQRVPAVFTRIHLHFVLIGAVKPEKAEQAIRLSVDQYCSVAAMLRSTAEITWDFEILAEKIT